MNIWNLPPVAVVLDGAHSLVTALADLLTPLVGVSAAAAAVVVTTLLVRLVLIPVGVSTARAEVSRRRLAPEIARLRERYRRDPQTMQRKTMELYGQHGASPLAGCLPLLAQAPVLFLVYSLFVLPEVGGHPNALLTEHLAGVSLGDSLVALLGAGQAPAAAPVFAVLLAVIAAAAFFSRRAMLRTTPEAPGLALLSWLPFATVVVAAFVPLAAGLYLAVTTSWTVVERAVLRRRVSDRQQSAR